MKTVLLYACVIFLISCQKEVMFPHQVKEEPSQVVIPEPDIQPAPEPQSAIDPLDPPPGTVSESVWLRNLPFIFNNENHYKLSQIFSENVDLWLKTPEWSKDDIHTFGKYGLGSIESTDQTCPDHPFTTMDQQWNAYADTDGIKLTWVDTKYQPVTYTLVYAVPGVKFKAFRIVNDVRIYSVFTLLPQTK